MAGQPLVGRHREQRCLQGWAARGGPHVLIDGAPGVGRSALIGWLVDDLRAQGGNAFVVAGTPPDVDRPLSSWLRLAIAAARADIEVPETLLDPASTAARDLAVLDLLDRLATGPAVVVFDDAHHADAASVELLARVAADPAKLPVLIVVVIGSAEEHSDERGRQALGHLAQTQRRLHLDVLTPEDTIEVVVTRAGAAARVWAQRWGASLWELSGGVPVLLTALIDDLGLATGARPELDRGVIDAVVDGNAPWARGLVRAVEARLAGLGAGLREVLGVIALGEDHLDVGMIAYVLERDVARDLQVGSDLGLLCRDERDRPAITLPLTRELLRRRRTDLTELHGRIGQVLLTQPGSTVSLAVALRHLVAADGRAEPARLDRLADEVVASPGSWDTAEDETQALQPLWLLAARHGRDQRWRRLGLRLADAWWRTGHRDRSWAVAGEILAACPDDADDDLVAAASRLARGQERSPSAPAAVRALEDAARRLGAGHPQTPRLLAVAGEVALALPTLGADLAALPEVPGALSTLGSRRRGATSTSVLGWTVRREPATVLIDEADALLRRDGAPPTDPGIVAEVDVAWTRVHRAPHEADGRLERAGRAATTTTDRRVQAAALARLVVNHLLVGNRSAADDALAQLTATAEDSGDPANGWRAQELTAMLALASGDPDTAQRAALEAFDLGERAGVASTWSVRIAQEHANSLEAHGRLARLPVHLPSVIVWHPLSAAGWCWAASLGPSVAGDAASDPADGLALIGGREVDVGHVLLYATLVADAAWRLRRADLAPALIELLAPWSELIAIDADGVYCHGSVARPLAGLRWLTGDLDGCLADEQRADGLDAGAGLHRFRLAGAVDRIVRARADQRLTREQSWTALREVQDEASSRGLGRIVAEVGAMLASEVAHLLTDRQVQVLYRLATGDTYRDIATELGFSHGTIRREAMAIYRALGVDGRESAAEVARAIGPHLPAAGAATT